MGCFQLGGIVNNPAMNISFEAKKNTYIYVGYMPGNEMLYHIICVYSLLIGIV